MMMTDKELLEAAAKAGAPEAPRHTKGWVYSKAGPRGEGMYASADRTQHWFWNPLTDDGDALRLAVKLCIDVKFSAGATWVKLREEDSTIDLHYEKHGADPRAATRRAIVRAAAALAPTPSDSSHA